jgi:transcriptional regulator with GAF, ATPase, and Fis domain
MKQPPRSTIDLTRDLRAVARLGTSVEVVDKLLSDALHALGRVIPFDLATIMELEGDQLRVRVSAGDLDRNAVRNHRLSLTAFPSLRQVLEDGHARAFVEHDHRDGDGDPFDGVLDLPHGHACMVVPLSARGEQIGVMTLDRRECQVYAPGVVDLADTFGRLLGLAISYGEQSALLARLRAQLEEQNRLLSDRVDGRSEPARLMESCKSAAMVHVTQLARQVAVTDTPVLITGETGTGKEVLANAIHAWSRRADQPLVSINCAALPASLIESELFGHVKGAFSGAVSARMGRFQAANGGTLFLDEIGEVPFDLQAKLLRVLQEGCFEPVGSDHTVRVDVRILAATNADLLAASSDRRFREDLYYRLAVFPVRLPPLRARREDIAPIADSFLGTLSRRTGRGPWTLSSRAAQWLELQPWPGNVRELVNALERATILAVQRTLDTDLFTLESGPPIGTLRPADSNASGLPSLRQMEREHVVLALQKTNGRLYGKGGAAELLGINGSTLYSRMKKLGLGGARSFTRRAR